MTKHEYMGGVVPKDHLDPEIEDMYRRASLQLGEWIRSDLWEFLEAHMEQDMAWTMTNSLVEELGYAPVGRWSDDFLY